VILSRAKSSGGWQGTNAKSDGEIWGETIQTGGLKTNTAAKAVFRLSPHQSGVRCGMQGLGVQGEGLEFRVQGLGIKVESIEDLGVMVV